VEPDGVRAVDLALRRDTQPGDGRRAPQGMSSHGALAVQDAEAAQQRLDLVLHRRAAARRHEQIEQLVLVRFDVEDAKIWLSTVQGLLKPAFNKLLGRKPEAGIKEKVAEVEL